MTANLRSQVLTSVKWLAATRVLAQGVSWVSTVLVMRLLAPADYGLLALATLFLGVLAFINDMGLAASIVQAPTLELPQLRRIGGLLVAGSSALALFVAFVVAPLQAQFFSEPQLLRIIQALALVFLPAALSTIPSALLEREMKFRERSLAELVSLIGTAGVVLWLALRGLGVWALVWGQVFQSTSRAVVLYLLRPFPHLPSFSFRGAGDHFRFGRDVFVARVLWYLYVQADTFLAGKLLGRDALGVYFLSAHIASLPLVRISTVVNEVALAAFAQARRQTGAVAEPMLKAARVLAFLGIPVLWGISSVSEELVTVVLGPKWEAAIPLIRVLCLVMPLRVFAEVLKSAVQGMGRADVVVRSTLNTAVVMTLAFLVGVQFGLMGLALAWLLAFPLAFLDSLMRAARVLDTGVGPMLRAMARPAAIGAAMYGAVHVARRALDLPPLPSLLCLSLLGAAVYTGLSLAANRGQWRETRNLVAASRPAAA